MKNIPEIVYIIDGEWFMAWISYMKSPKKFKEPKSINNYKIRGMIQD